MVKSFFEFFNAIVIEAVDVELHHAGNFVVIFGSLGHRSPPFSGLAGLMALTSSVIATAENLIRFRTLNKGRPRRIIDRSLKSPCFSALNRWCEYLDFWRGVKAKGLRQRLIPLSQVTATMAQADVL